jgi:glutamine amidotransferase
MYHVHSFAVKPADPSIVAGTATYGNDFVSAVEEGDVFGVQFHPEKSSRDGLALLRNFVNVGVPV